MRRYEISPYLDMVRFGHPRIQKYTNGFFSHCLKAKIQTGAGEKCVQLTGSENLHTVENNCAQTEIKRGFAISGFYFMPTVSLFLPALAEKLGRQNSTLADYSIFPVID